MKWFLYIAKCRDGSFYTGITTDITRRIAQHNRKTGAKAVRGRIPVELVYLEEHNNRSEVSKRESMIKMLSREQKKVFIERSVA